MAAPRAYDEVRVRAIAAKPPHRRTGAEDAALRAARDAGFEEADHPRDEGGQFTSGAGASGKKTPKAEPMAAVKASIKKSGFTPFKRPDPYDPAKEGPHDIVGYLSKGYGPGKKEERSGTEKSLIRRQIKEYQGYHSQALNQGRTESAKSLAGHIDKLHAKLEDPAPAEHSTRDHPLSVEHEGKTYYQTGKLGTHTATGERAAEYSHHDEERGLEHRTWHLTPSSRVVPE